ncbi:MAG: SagB/ThcOx family dehydrogenase [Candidatus Omnitrophica bacterium]|nr:SagB/ThcOx family dehydrogenase [Candidatus Omnitrophota bacterium]MCM8831665.1 SagB/ThcOx family dehydrogenase [Candidatus Omnitrophota bacterium]
MKKFYFLMLLIGIIMASIFKGFSKETNLIRLPSPRENSDFSLEKAITTRRSIRDFSLKPIKIEELSQIVWAAYGKNKYGKITTPSAGALYPLKIYALCFNVEGLKKGLYRYESNQHALVFISDFNLEKKLVKSCLGQRWIEEAAVNIIICADYEITTSHYGERGRRYVQIEVGHTAQNIYLQVEALGLGTVAVGAFIDEEVKNILGLEEEPLYIMPIGRRK